MLTLREKTILSKSAWCIFSIAIQGTLFPSQLQSTQRLLDIISFSITRTGHRTFVTQLISSNMYYESVTNEDRPCIAGSGGLPSSTALMNRISAGK